MTFAAKEESRYSGQPINLYLFTYGDGPDHYFAYTDAEFMVTFDNGTVEANYLPIPIERGKISSSGSLDKTNVTVSTPHNSDIANLYLIYPPSRVTTLIMYQGHVNDPDDEFKAVWSGRVIAAARKGSKAEFTCEPISTSMRRNGCRRRYQYGCPLVLYGSDCRASKVAATTTTAVAGFTGSRITLGGAWAGLANAAKYVQGLAEWTAPDGTREVRTILRAENGGITFLLGGSTRGISIGTPVDMIYGCNHRSGTSAQPDGDCGPLHDNILNFGGQERIPFKNPIGFVNQFY